MFWNQVLNECFINFAKFPVQKLTKSTRFWTRFWANALSALRSVRFKN